MPQRTLLVLLIAACTLSSGCATARPLSGQREYFHAHRLSY